MVNIFCYKLYTYLLSIGQKYKITSVKQGGTIQGLGRRVPISGKICSAIILCPLLVLLIKITRAIEQNLSDCLDGSNNALAVMT